MKINESVNQKVSGLLVEIKRPSKWTYICNDITGKKICSAASMPKLIKKIEDHVESLKPALIKTSGRLIKERDDKVKAKKSASKKSTSKKVTVTKKAGRLAAKGSSIQNVPKPKGSIKTLTFGMITENKSDDEIIAAVKKDFPESKFNQSHISWYRSTLYRDGVIGPEHAPRRTKVYKDWKVANSEK